MHTSRGASRRIQLSHTRESATHAREMPSKQVLLNREPRRRGRPVHDSANTREALLDAAEELFATVGVERASMRAISTVAGLTHAAVNYHYPSKEAVLDAVLSRRGKGTVRRFDELLSQLEAIRRKPTAAQLIEAMAMPNVEVLLEDPVGGRRWLRIVAGLMLAEDPRLLQSSYVPPSIHERWFRLLARAYPGVPDSFRLTCNYLCTAIIVEMLGNSDILFEREALVRTHLTAQKYIKVVTKFAACGFAGVMADAARANAKRKQRQPR